MMKDYIPAGAGEKMQYIVHPFNDNTIRFVLRYPGMLRAEVLKQAAHALVSSVDVLHASFEAGRLQARWHVQDVSADQCFVHIADAQDPVSEALAQALQPVSASGPVQMRCVLAQGARECAVALLVSHLCVDGSDGKYLLGKLCEAYNLMLAEGSCARLSVKRGSRAAEQVYAHLSREERRRLIRDPRTGIKSEFPFTTAEEGSPAVIRAHIPAGVMACAHEKARALGATINDLLLTACYYAYAETAQLDEGAPMSIMSMMDLRRHCEGGDSAGLCNLTGALTTALPGGTESSFEGTLRNIAAQTRRSKQDPLAGLYGMPLLHGAAKRLPLELLLSVAGRLYGSMAVGMTNVGSIDCSQLAMGGILPAEGWFGGPLKRKPGVQVSAASFGGACSLAIWGNAAGQDKPLLTAFLSRICRQVSEFAMPPAAEDKNP